MSLWSGLGGLMDGLNLGAGGFTLPKKGAPVDRGIPEGMNPRATTQAALSPDASFMQQAQQLAGNQSGVGRYGEQFTPPPAPQQYQSAPAPQAAPSPAPSPAPAPKPTPAPAQGIPPEVLGRLGNGIYGRLFDGLNLGSFQPAPTPAPQPKPAPKPTPAPAPQPIPQPAPALPPEFMYGSPFMGLNRFRF